MSKECFGCGTPLLGGLDTFGPIHRPLCQGCFLSTAEKTDQWVHTIEFDGQGHVVAEGIKKIRTEEEDGDQ